MFGLLFSLLVGGAHVVKDFRDTAENARCIQSWSHDEDGLYYDRRGFCYDKYTGRHVKIQHDYETNEVWVVDCATFQRLRNLTAERDYRHYQEERMKYLNGTTARTYVRYGMNDHRNDKCQGVRYKDLENGKIYVAREIPGVYYEINGEKYFAGRIVHCLMDLQTYQYIRPTDSALAHYAGKLDKIKVLYESIEKANKEKNKNLQEYEKTKDINPSDLWWYEKYLYEHPLVGDVEELSEKDNDFLVSRGMSLKEYTKQFAEQKEIYA